MKSDQPANLFVVIIGSAVANLALWCALGLGSSQPVHVVTPPELVFDRVVVDNKDKTAKPIFRPIKPKAPPKVLPKPDEPKQPRPRPTPPEGAHNRLVTAKTPDKSPSEDHFVVPNGGNAPLGRPTDSQRPGTGVVNPPTPPPPTPPAPVTTKPVVTPPAPPPPAPVVAPKHEDAPPPPPPPPPPKPKGETREAKPDHQQSVEIPENLKSQSFKSFVRVRVNISADGTFTVVLRTSSGNTDVDKLVLDTLNKWTWKPALKDGEAVDSVQQFRFNFSVE